MDFVLFLGFYGSGSSGNQLIETSAAFVQPAYGDEDDATTKTTATPVVHGVLYTLQAWHNVVSQLQEKQGRRKHLGVSKTQAAAVW